MQNGTKKQPATVNEIQNKPKTRSVIANVENTTEKTQRSNTSGKEIVKTPGFEVVYGIISLFAVFLHKIK